MSQLSCCCSVRFWCGWIQGFPRLFAHLTTFNEIMDLLFDWEEDRDRYSFEDSDRFEDDSFCSWISEPESLCNNWRGWRKPNNGLGNAPATGNFSVQFFPSTLTASLVASVFPNQQKSSGTKILHLPFSSEICQNVFVSMVQH